MAPFNTHFLIAETIWPEAKTLTTWPESGDKILYGQFCFGCVAPDVDKVSSALAQKDTHFFDRSGLWALMASHRSAALIQNQADFFRRPFDQLRSAEQAFALGYLCHLCVDEVSKAMWQSETWTHFKDIGPGPTFAALDEAAREQIKDYAALVQSLHAIEPLPVIPRIPLEDLVTVWQGVCQFVGAGTAEAEYLALVDVFDRPSPETRQQKQQDFRAKIDLARQQVHLLHLETLVEGGVAHSRRRLWELINDHVPKPGYPEINL
jgi:hypothetical protein